MLSTWAGRPAVRCVNQAFALCRVVQSEVGPAGLSMIEIRRFRSEDLDAVVGLCSAEGWDAYVTDPERTCHALSAAGVITVVAVEDGNVWGFAQLLTDGAIRAYLVT